MLQLGRTRNLSCETRTAFNSRATTHANKNKSKLASSKVWQTRKLLTALSSAKLGTGSRTISEPHNCWTFWGKKKSHPVRGGGDACACTPVCLCLRNCSDRDGAGRRTAISHTHPPTNPSKGTRARTYTSTQTCTHAYVRVSTCTSDLSDPPGNSHLTGWPVP